MERWMCRLVQSSGSSKPFSSELAMAGANDLKLHIMGAVYGAMLEWATGDDGEEPPPEVDSHRLEGPIGLRRKWDHRFLTLESKWDNKLRRACAVALIKKLASGILPPDARLVLRQHLEVSQATRPQPEAGDFSLVEGNNMLLQHHAGVWRQYATGELLQQGRGARLSLLSHSDSSVRNLWSHLRRRPMGPSSRWEFCKVQGQALQTNPLSPAARRKQPPAGSNKC